MDIFSSITIEGQIISAEVLSNLKQEGTAYQKPEDFGFTENQKLRDEIQFAYSQARKQWSIFKDQAERLSQDETGTSETRRYWILPLLGYLGYNPEHSTAEIVNNRSYAISHRDNDRHAFPIHIMGIHDNIDKKRDTGGPRLSPHGLVQEYLNMTEHLFGLVSNGYKLRLLRDSSRFSRLSFVEFDLQAMMEDELYSDFAVMYRLIHSSRMPVKSEDSADSIIEHYHQDAIESGARIREKLRVKVEQTLQMLGNGFLNHPANQSLRQEFLDVGMDASGYYGKLLKIIYRFLFLMVIEERKLVFPKKEDIKGEWNEEQLKEYREIYEKYYSIHHLRNLAEKRHQLDPDSEDLWEQLKKTFQLFEKESMGSRLGIQALNGDLFSVKALDPLDECSLKNDVLLRALDAIARFENENGQMTRVNYGALDVEEFGSVYESLLDHEPIVDRGATAEHETEWGFRFSEGTERKTTGSYYTRPELVQELVKSALEPVIEERLEKAETDEEKVRELISLKVCDPAAGSGHFLLAAARKISDHLVVARYGEDYSLMEQRLAMREVVKHCIYGVDLNPMAVELCKVALWLESYSVGLPLTFLDHHVKNGNSLVGVDDLKHLNDGIPDGAFKEVLGDVKKVAQKLKKRNKKEREKGKQTELQASTGSEEIALEKFADRLDEIDAMPERSVEETTRKKLAYQSFKQSREFQQAVTAANIWTGAFFIEKTEEHVDKKLIATSSGLHSYIANPKGSYPPMTAKMDALAVDQKFFHWPLEYPEVFTKGGFDVVLGNPPWENVQPEETKFFAAKKPELANLPGSKRKKAIKKLKQEKDPVYFQWQKHKQDIKRVVQFTKEAGRNDLTAKGKINTYRLFSDLNRDLLNNKGRTGMIVPTGIATDNTSKYFFGDVVEQKAILSLFDFENREKLFEDVDSRQKFCLLTLGGTDYKNREVEADFAFFLTHPNQLDDDIRRFKLTPEDLERINPNTKTTPIFRTQPDAEITRKIYRNFPVLIRHTFDKKGNKNGEINSWGVNFRQGLFNMTSDSNLFFDEDGPERLPLYEAKFIWHYDHRFATFDEQGENTRDVTLEEKQNPDYKITPRYWVDEKEVWVRLTKVPKDVAEAWKSGDEETMETAVAWWIWDEEYDGIPATEWLEKLDLNNKKYLPESNTDKRNARKMSKEFKLSDEDLNLLLNEGINEGLRDLIKTNMPKWLVGFRDITNATNERTAVNSIFPVSGVGNNLPVMITESSYNYLLNANVSSIIFDFVARHKVGGTHMNFFIIEQLPALSENNYTNQDREFIKQRVIELTYTSHDLKPFVESLGFMGEPFTWDEDRRALLKTELDAYYAKLYGLNREELLYILDPEAVYGEDFPGETFRGLKKKEMKKHGEYRTKRLVLEAWDRLEKGEPMMSEEKEQPIGTDLVHSEKGKDMLPFGVDTGIYTVRDTMNVINSVVEKESARVNYGKVRRWFKELADINYQGIDLAAKDDIDNLRISFHGLIELYVIGILRDAGFVLNKIMTARESLAEKTGKIYPFATNNVRDNLKVAGRSIIFTLPNGDKISLDGTSQLNLDLIKEFFRDIKFDTDGIARRIIPEKGNNEIVIDPVLCGGKPAVESVKLEVETIQAFLESGESKEVIMDQYGLTESALDAVLKFTN